MADKKEFLDESVSGATGTDISTIYENNDTCITISPFDMYKKIVLYKTDNNGTVLNFDLDRNDEYRYFLVFGSGKKTIRIPEFYGDYYEHGMSVKLAMNEIVFRISKDNASDILSLPSNIFHIVRETLNFADDGEVIVSDTQSIFFGKWGDEATAKYIDDSNNTVNELSSVVKQLKSENNELQVTALELNKRIIELENELESMRSSEKYYRESYEELIAKNSSSNEYEATSVEGATYINISVDTEELQSQLQSTLNKYTESLEDTQVN